MKEIMDRLKAVRNEMKKENVSALIVPTSDYHDTEYVAPYFQAREYLSGFSGSAGTLVILDNKAALWVDGRYFLQAEKQLKGTGIDLMKIGQPNTPSIAKYLYDNLEAGDVAAVDGGTLSKKLYDEYSDLLSRKGITFKLDVDFPGRIWKDRPAFPATQTFVLDERYSGESTASKLERMRKEMKADLLLLSKIDEIAWLLNLRSHDIPDLPAALCFFLLGKEKGTLYINQKRLDEASRKMLKENGIELKDYEQIYGDLEEIDQSIQLSENSSARLSQSIAHPLFEENPIFYAKAVKNPVELEGFRKAHIKDGAAFVELMYWLEHLDHPVTEIDVVRKLYDLRAQKPLFLGDSFETICADTDHASMIHYHPDQIHPRTISDHGFLLIDFGSHYLEGTTDATRTLVLGDLSQEEKDRFTDVLKGHIALSTIHFPKGVNGGELDVLARAPLWRLNLDFNHGTGHGVGHVTTVHEGPNSFRWSAVSQPAMQAGMITSNEPGYYKDDAFGIRHENLLECVEVVDENGRPGRFLAFEPLTRIPFEKKGLNLERLTQDEIDWINTYHRQVFEDLKDEVPEELLDYLREKTAPIEPERKSV